MVTGFLEEWVSSGAAVLVATHDPGLVERAEEHISLLTGTGEEAERAGGNEQGAAGD